MAGGLLLFGGMRLAPVLASDAPTLAAPAIATTVRQLQAMPSADFLRACPIRLTGLVTMVDTNRNWFVLQDKTGAVGIHLDTNGTGVAPGMLVSFETAEAIPFLVGLPDFPFRPSGSDIQPQFEAPSNWGSYHLTWMRGLLRPPVTGDYTFWIASDNSSELWLSTGPDASQVRRIAFVATGNWVDPREWSRYPSQRSEAITLRAGESYYIEAFQEQLGEDDNLAVAWQGPGMVQSVIAGAFLIPGGDGVQPVALAHTNGILREYWTNYSAGTLAGVTGPRAFQSALSVKAARITVSGKGNWPVPLRVALDQPLSPEDNYRWVETEGAVTFVGEVGDAANLELTDGEGLANVRISNWRGKPLPALQSWVSVRGVCEAVQNARGQDAPGLIWMPSDQELTVMEHTNSRLSAMVLAPSERLNQASSNTALSGYYYTRAVVTFNDRVLGRDCLFAQDESSGMRLTSSDPRLGEQLQVGRWADLSGHLLPGKYAPALNLAIVGVVGRHEMPEPEGEPLELPPPSSREGRWTELTGVVRALNPDGMLLMMLKGGPIRVWVGHSSTNDLARYVDATLRARGVLSLATHESPVLLVPSGEFVEVDQSPPPDPFRLESRSVASLTPGGAESPSAHRVKVTGWVIFRNEKVLFVEDRSGGVRVQTLEPPMARVGDDVEVAGFPEFNHSLPVLSEALSRRIGTQRAIVPARVDLGEALAGRHNCRLVQLKATYLGRKSSETSQVLELQSEQRVFQAVLANNLGTMPRWQVGSVLELTGVSEVELNAPPGLGAAGEDSPPLAAVQLILRGPADAVLLSGPPWWTWKRASVLVGALSAVLMGSLLWIHLLRLRLERQQAARLAFSRHILEGQETERHRIAANLHDGLGQNLLVIKNQARLGLQTSSDESGLRHRLDEISSLASQAIEEVRQITHDLRPYQLDRLGLTQAIRAVVNRVSENSPIVFASHVDDIDGLFDKESEIHVYRIVQESLSNIVKHSGATEAAVVLKRQAGAISLSIRDNGCGFEIGPGGPAGRLGAGAGLGGISERVRILGGNLDLNSRPGQGTSLACEIPLPSAA